MKKLLVLSLFAFNFLFVSHAFATVDEIWVQGDGSPGTLPTTIATFSNTIVSTGTHITYSRDTTNGDTFTVTQDGVYFMSYSAGLDSNSAFGITVDQANLTQDIYHASTSERLCVTSTNSGNPASCSVTVYLTSGQVIRANQSGSTHNGSIPETNIFHMVRLAQ